MHFFWKFGLKNIGVSQSNRLAPKIGQNTESLKFSIVQNNVNRKFGLNLGSHDMPLHDSRRKESHRNFKGVSEGYFFQRGLVRALLPTSVPVRRSFSPFITPTALIATMTFGFTTLRLTPFDAPVVFLRNCPMGVIAWGIGSTRPKGAIGDTPIRTVVHIRLFTLLTMFGTRNTKGLIGRWRFRPGSAVFFAGGLG